MEIVPISSSATLTRGLVSGDLDSIDATPSAGAFLAVEEGADVKVVAGTMPGVSYLVYTRPGIDRLDQIPGHTVAICQPGSYPHMVIMALLDKYGIDHRGIRWVTVGGPADMVRALLVGRVDVAPGTTEFQPMVEEAGGQVLANVGVEMPEMIRFAFITNGRAIREKPDILTNVLAGYAEGIRYAIENREESIDLAARISGLSRSEANWIYDQFIEHLWVAPNLYVSPEAIDFVQETSVKLGIQSRKLPMETVATWEFQERVSA